jgi:hypothetical protein
MSLDKLVSSLKEKHSDKVRLAEEREKIQEIKELITEAVKAFKPELDKFKEDLIQLFPDMLIGCYMDSEIALSKTGGKGYYEKNKEEKNCYIKLSLRVDKDTKSIVFIKNYVINKSKIHVYPSDIANEVIGRVPFDVSKESLLKEIRDKFSFLASGYL